MQKIWMGATGVILVAVVVVGGLHIWGQVPKNILATAPLDKSCNLEAGFCEAHFPGNARVTFSITPRPIEGLKPLQLQVKTEGIDAEMVEVDFRGLGMSMGFNRPRLAKDAEGEYSGMGTLFVCILDRMTWEATVLVSTSSGVYAAPFRFETVRN